MRFRTVLATLGVACVMAFAGAGAGKEIREPAVQVALDVPDTWTIDREADYATASPPDKSFLVLIKSMDYGDLTDATVEARAKAFLGEGLSDMVIDERPKA